MITEQPPEKKPTYRELWWDQGATLLDIWQIGTKLDAQMVSMLWTHSLVPRYVAQQALREYNTLFGTAYTLDQVMIPTLESLGYGRRFHASEGETSIALGRTWEYYGS